jgi:hypothetical protein
VPPLLPCRIFTCARVHVCMCDQDSVSKAATPAGGTCAKKRGRVAEEVEDKLMLKRAEVDASGKAIGRFVQLSEQPPLLRNGTLRDYQLEGVRWLAHLYHNNINGILADEMGLGKTVQAIGMIAYLAEQARGSKSCVIAYALSRKSSLCVIAIVIVTIIVVVVGGGGGGIGVMIMMMIIMMMMMMISILCICSCMCVCVCVRACVRARICRPKSVLSNWMKEFAKWLPSQRVVMLGGTKEERAAQLKTIRYS